MAEQEEFGDSEDKSVSYSSNTLGASLRIRVSDDGNSFMINIHLAYRPDEILPYQVEFESEGDVFGYSIHFWRKPK